MFGELSVRAQSLWAKKSHNRELDWLPLSVHLSDAAFLARKIWNVWLSDGVRNEIASSIGSEVDAEKLFVFLSAAHDIGKATPVFQAKRAGYPTSDIDECIDEELNKVGIPIKPFHQFSHPEKTPHALASQLLLEKQGVNKNLAVILGAHHGKPPGVVELTEYSIETYRENYFLDKVSQPLWISIHNEFIQYALDLAGYSCTKELPEPRLSCQVLLTGLVIMTDWISSNESLFPYFRINEKHSEISDVRCKKAWREFGVPHNWTPGNDWAFTDICNKRFEFSANDLQIAVENKAGQIEKPGILIIEASMGAGKTEAALIASEIFANKSGREGVLLALPTQATSDGIFPRLLQWISKLDDDCSHSIELAHGKAQFNQDFQALKYLDGSTNIWDEDGSSAIVHSWFKGRKKALLADFVVGTIDQLLLAGLKQKHVMLRHLGLANKVVIIDECHAYDAYMSSYLEMVLRWLGAYHVPVIVLSATLPAQTRELVVNAYLNKKKKSNSFRASEKDKLREKPQWIRSLQYPLLTWTDDGDVYHECVNSKSDICEVEINTIEDNQIIERLDGLLSNGGCAGIIVNTVVRAQTLAKAFRDHFGPEVVSLVHSRFITPDRVKKERQILDDLGKQKKGMKRPEKCIVIGTQVLEQSLDIDFDIMFTDVCPMDLLLQRIGRLHRHRRNRPDKLRVAMCFITGISKDSFEEGTRKIYGDYLLIRTKSLLPDKVVLPRDIPVLVQAAYQEEDSIEHEPTEYSNAKKSWEKIIEDKEKRAKTFRIHRPWQDSRANMIGFLDADVTEKHGEAAVRDSDESIEVLLIQHHQNGRLQLMSKGYSDLLLNPNEVPDEKSAQVLACQSIRLPRALCMPYLINSTIEELEQINMTHLPCWQESPWLKGELFLILDCFGCVTLGEYQLTYNYEDGLITEKNGDDKDE